jgi:hypothetical protein
VLLSNDVSVLDIEAYGNDGNGDYSGHVRVYSWDGTIYLQRGSNIDGKAAGDYSGCSVSLSNDDSVLAVGACYNCGNGNDSGHVRVYSWDGTTYLQCGSDIDGEAAWDYSGWSVSLSNDGSVLAIGGIDETAYYSGHVRVYSWDGTTYLRRGSDIDGKADCDVTGFSVSLSNDGSVLAIGAYVNDGNGYDSGHVCVYNLYLPSHTLKQEVSGIFKSQKKCWDTHQVGGVM